MYTTCPEHLPSKDFALCLKLGLFYHTQESVKTYNSKTMHGRTPGRFCKRSDYVSRDISETLHGFTSESNQHTLSA
jgi:hypothetical protein